MRVVALIPGGIADQILFFPTLDDIKHNFPGTEIDVVVTPQAKEAYRVCRSVDDVILFDYEDRNSPADWANLLGVIRDRYYDVALTLKPGFGLGLLLWLTGTPVRIGYEKSVGRLFLTNPVRPQIEHTYLPEQYHDLLQGLGVSSPCPELAITVPKADLDWAEVEQQRLGIRGSGYVLIYPGAGDPTQLYPIEKWQQILQDFQHRQPDLPLVLVQDSDNQALVKELTTATNFKVTKPESAGHLAAMIAGASLILTTEILPMHLGVGLQVYTLALLGTADPAQLLPENDKFIGLKSGTGQLRDIAPQAVLEKVWGG
jgi:ADP-heptose:LPS heptosyltransferase